jgi:hypothetical protein
MPKEEAEDKTAEKTEEHVDEEDPDFFGAEALLLLAESASTPTSADWHQAEDQVPSSSMAELDEDNSSGGGLAVLCEGIDYLDSLPHLPGLDLLCSITRQVLRVRVT